MAAIDLGSNTVRLLVADVEGMTWRARYQAQRMTRLGAGLAGGPALDETAMARTASAVGELVAAARRCGAERIRIVATSAVREAANGREFCARLRALTGEPVEVLSGEEEARLTLAGVRAGLPGLTMPFVLLDIGGGSTEVALARDRMPPLAVSLRLGVVELAERFTGGDPVAPHRFEAMCRHIAGRLAAEIPAALGAAGARTVVGTAGSVTTLAALDLGLTAYDPAQVHGHRLSRAAIERCLGALAPLPAAARARIPCVEAGRADLLIPGIGLCLMVLDHLALPAIVVSDHGLREGILCGAAPPGPAG